MRLFSWSTNAEHCHQFTALIQQAIKDAAITHKSSSIEKLLTLSIGYYCITPDKNTTPQCFINRADKALYQAKETGRNKSLPI
ncbi:diguanylate cyclase domain-containing protein (plasmid) [Pseudoalteromonas espejiana]